MQIVYLSARPDVLRETLGHVRHFAPFIDDVVIVAPERMADRFTELGTVLTDESLTGLSTVELKALAHTSRNYLLRTTMVGHAAVADRFIMSDDDARPLEAIDETTFLTADDKYRRRWFHTLGNWKRTTTDFDESLLHTWVILRQMGFTDPVSFASHMPQIIDKALYASVAETFAPYADTYALDEWSTYFTLAADQHPDRFADPEPFLTLGWPQYPGSGPIRSRRRGTCLRTTIPSCMTRVGCTTGWRRRVCPRRSRRRTSRRSSGGIDLKFRSATLSFLMMSNSRGPRLTPGARWRSRG